MNRQRGMELKSRRELDIMRQAGKVNAEALLAAIRAAKAGVTTEVVNQAAAAVLENHKAQPAFVGVPGAYPYPAVTTISINEELVHGIPGDRVLHEGDIVSIDCGTILDGFVADSAITIAIGRISEEAQQLMQATEDSLFAGIDKMRIGNRSGDVSAAIQAVVEAAGFNVVREYTGHGVGRTMHEAPQVPNYGNAGHGVPLRKGLTIALEPMVLAGDFRTRVLDDQWTVASADRRLTAHYEHSIAVTADGPRILTALADPESLDAEEKVRYNRYFAGLIAPTNVKESDQSKEFGS
ncbi:MAG: type I methionyl aminopeptidase [Anaerolineales bacterium]